MRKKGLALLVAMIMVTSLVMPVFAASMPFADVPKDHWAYDSVAELTASGLIIGYPDGSFKGERQFTRYEMAMVFARVLGRLDTLIAAEVGAELKAGTAGLSESIYAEVAKTLADEMAKVKAELSAHVDEELANVELPEAKVVERVVVEQPVERPFELTDEAKAVIAKTVADMVAENVAGLEPKVVEKLVEAEPGITAKDLQGLMAAVANAQSTADFNAMDIEELQAQVAAARLLIEDLTFSMDVIEATAEVADQKADNAAAEAAEAKAIGLAATDGALAALTAAEVAGADAAEALVAVEATNQEVRNLAIAISALEGDVVALSILLEDTANALEAEIAAMTAEFDAELASLGVRVADLEAIVVDNTARIDALEEDLAQHKAETVEDIVSLRVADIFLEEAIHDVADAQAETAEYVAVVDAEQKATAADFAEFKENHEKVSLSGSTKTVFHNVGIVDGGSAGFGDDDEFFKDPRDRDDDETYERKAKLGQDFVLELEAVPADGVSVKATLADTVNVLGDKDDKETKFGLSNISLELTTDKALRSLYAGAIDEEDLAARYNEFIVHDENGDTEGVVANVVLGKLDTEIQLFRPWEDEIKVLDDDGDVAETRYGKYAVLVNSAYSFSDAFVIDVQYARLATDGTADLDVADDPADDYAYSVGLSGEFTFADYELAFARNDDEKSAYKFYVGKTYDNEATWDVTYKAVEDGYVTYLTDSGVDNYKTNLKLSADNFKLIGLELGGAYVRKEANPNLYKAADKRKSDVTAMKFTVAKHDLFLDGLSVSGQYANIDKDALGKDDNSSLLGKIAYEPTFGKLQLGASYEYTTNAIAGDFDNPNKWVNKHFDAKKAPESTVALSAEYPLEVWDTTITGFVGYENRTSKEEKATDYQGREYDKALMTYKISAEREIGSANVLASYRYRTGGAKDHDNKDLDKYGKWAPEVDKTADFKLTYPVVGDADLELGYRWMDVEAYDKDYSYTVNEINAGLKFTF